MKTNEKILSEQTDDKIEIERLSRTLAEKASLLNKRGMSLVIALEGLDASGKSGCAKRITEFMNKEYFKVVHISAPTDEEKKYPWLWRFWKETPRIGNTAVFDRSWYGRVLVERVEKLCSEEEWKRAYGEINKFEQYLTDNGVLLVKFWLDISDEEQLKRFRDRASDPKKAHKITDEDWRNRSRRSEYEKAVLDMFRFCDKETARWYVVPANQKKTARKTVLKTIINEIEKRELP